MKVVISVGILLCTAILAACSFSYRIVIVNETEAPIRIEYTISEDGRFDDPQVQGLGDWESRKSISRFWTGAKSWIPMSSAHFATESRTRIITLAPKQVVIVESHNYNPIPEERGEMTDIVELTLSGEKGEINLKGKLLLSEFEREDHTFIKVYKDALGYRN
jgi:hypothetical protein